VIGVHAFRATGRMRPPTAGEIRAYAARIHLDVSDDEIAVYSMAVGGLLEQFEELEEEPAPAVGSRYWHRDPGRAPTVAEDPYNAVIRFCDVRGTEDGPLRGRRVAVKDCIAVAGVPMTSGGRRQPVPVPSEDAIVVERLLDAGACVVAKTNMPDMALGLGESSAFGATRNPRNPRYSTGGSSSGSAAAVAAGLADIALGSDEGGSVRIPAAWCGLVGMKATHGLVPSFGLAYMDHTIDHIGPITATVADNALMLEVIAGGDWRDPQWVRADPVAGNYSRSAGLGLAGARFGVIAESLEPSGCTPETLAAFADTTEVLTSLGANVMPKSIPLWTKSRNLLLGCLGFGLRAMLESCGQGYGHLGRVDVPLLATTAAQMRDTGRDLPLVLRAMLLTAEHLRSAYHGVHLGIAQNLRLELRRQVCALFDDVDLLITPTTPCGPTELATDILGDAGVMLHEGTDAARNACPLDLTGHPAISVPASVGAHNIPTGLQIIGPHFGETQVYRAAFAFEDAIDPLPDRSAAGPSKGQDDVSFSY
jgi:amidase